MSGHFSPAFSARRVPLSTTIPAGMPRTTAQSVDRTLGLRRAVERRTWLELGPVEGTPTKRKCYGPRRIPGAVADER